MALAVPLSAGGGGDEMRRTGGPQLWWSGTVRSARYQPPTSTGCSPDSPHPPFALDPSVVGDTGVDA